METDDNPISNPTGCSLVDLLSIDLVGDKVFSYLNLQDLKLLSEASKGILNLVRKSNDYSNKATLVIGNCALHNDLGFFKVFLDTSIWEGRKLRIDADILVESLRAMELDSFLNNMESINFYLPDSAKSDSDVVNFLTFVLEKAESLNHLGLEPVILTKGLQDIISKPGVASNLKNLKTLQFQSSQTLIVRFIDQALRISKALQALNQAIGLENLKKLIFRDVEINYWHLEGLFGIIKRNKDNLEELELHRDIWRLEEMEDIQIPKLKRLILSTPDAEAARDIVPEFLANQGQLEHLDISLHDQFPLEIIRIIEEKQLHLKSLRILAKSFSSEGQDQMSWKFLIKFTKLKRIWISKLFDGRNNSNDTNTDHILSCIPSTVEAVGLQGLENLWHSSIPPFERNIWERLSQLKNLTEVDLHGSRDGLSSVGLQDLIRHCPQITSLAFSHSNVTNFGVTGVDLTGRKTGVSLDQLTRLRSLSIEACPGIGKDQLFSVVKFNFLTRFHYDGRFKSLKSDRARQTPIEELILRDYVGKTGKDEISQLLSQNPWLNDLSLFLPFPNEMDYAEVKHLRGRLTIFKHGLKELRLGNINSRPKRSRYELPSSDDYDGDIDA